MNEGKTFFDLPQAQTVPAGSRYAVEMGDGSGTKSVTHEDVVKAVGEYLPLGDIDQLETDVKTDYVSAINEIKKKADASSGGATLQVKTSDPGLYGRTVTVSDGENEMSAVMSFGGECVITGILMTGDLTVSASTEDGETDEAETHVDNYATYYTDLDTRSGYHRLNVLTSDTGLIGKAVTASNGEDTVTGIISQDGRARLVFAFTGAVTVSASDDAGNIVSASINIGSDTTSYDVWLQAGNIISDAFSEGKSYSAGDYAIYKDALYRFTITKTAGAWNPKAVSPVTVAAVLSELNENISKKQDASTAITTGNIGQQSVLNASTAHSVAWDDVYSKPTTGYPPSSHTHDDRYYTESEVNNLLNGKAASSHTHDDRYYTESEVNNLIWNEIHVKEYSADNVSVSTGTKTQEFSIALPGYWIVGLVQASIENASSGGINSSQCSIYGYGFYSQSTAYVRFRAWADAKVKVIIKVLYWKDPR